MENKLTEKEIFEKLKNLKEKDVMIHVSIKDGRLKVENAESKITSVYPFLTDIPKPLQPEACQYSCHPPMQYHR